ncbi:MAG: DUF4348 domain-containing protein [Flavobacterium sp.]|nr:DUF4348 domain-containing protein [Flavobacterium sp.]
MKTNPFILLILLLLLSCKNNEDKVIPENNTVTNNKEQTMTDEDFSVFIAKFVTDKSFRHERITFPLRGYNSAAMNPELTDQDTLYMFDKADFDFSSEEDFQKPTNGDVLKNKTIKTDSSMIYRIYKENSGYDMRYNFKLKDQKWVLIYYSYANY